MTADELHCAAWTGCHGFDPIGSATRFDRLLVVEVPLPWPAEIESSRVLAGLEAPPGTRLQAVVPPPDRAGDVGLVTRWERAGAGFTGLDVRVAQAGLGPVLAALAAGAVASDLPRGAESSAAPDEVLVCTHGARDRCCGGAGTRLAAEAIAELGEVRVRRTSHLGGHRFAPTALTLPDGRLWAHLDGPTLAAVVRRTVLPAGVRHHYRGNAALDPWNQVLEAELLCREGWLELDGLSGTVTTDGAGARAVLTWRGRAGAGSVAGRVEVVERYPVLVCGAPPEAAEKTSPVYALAGPVV